MTLACPTPNAPWHPGRCSFSQGFSPLSKLVSTCVRTRPEMWGALLAQRTSIHRILSAWVRGLVCIAGCTWRLRMASQLWERSAHSSSAALEPHLLKPSEIRCWCNCRVSVLARPLQHLAPCSTTKQYARAGLIACALQAEARPYHRLKTQVNIRA